MKIYKETEFCFFYLETEILHFKYKSIPFLTLGIAQEVVSSRMTFQEGEEMAVFCDTRGIMDSGKEARDYLAREGSLLVTVIALFDDRNVASFMMDYYHFRNRPIVPSFYFSERKAALDFLNQYIQK